MAKRHISITNPKVLDIFDAAVKEKRGSRLIEEAILFYSESINEERVNKELVQSMIIDALKNVVAAPISNQNYTQDTEDLKSIIDDIMN